ncbi:Tn3 family transposase [Streptomyces sioyaensis]|uniref:Tn3 family transposase n=1 Tax=Streptomyces sioyaensis TaxID=67364 RepID=UPI0033E2E13B
MGREPRKALLQDDAWGNARPRAAASACRQSPGATWTAGAANSTTTTGACTPASPTILTYASSSAPRTAHCAGHLVLNGLDKLTEPAGLPTCARRSTPASPVDLPELLLEVHAWTGFLNHFPHVSEAGSRAEHLVVSLAAVLVAEACNSGIQAMVCEDEPAAPATSRSGSSRITCAPKASAGRRRPCRLPGLAHRRALGRRRARLRRRPALCQPVASPSTPVRTRTSPAAADAVAARSCGVGSCRSGLSWTGSLRARRPGLRRRPPDTSNPGHGRGSQGVQGEGGLFRAPLGEQLLERWQKYDTRMAFVVWRTGRVSWSESREGLHRFQAEGIATFSASGSVRAARVPSAGSACDSRPSVRSR